MRAGRTYLEMAGKTGPKVAAVFGISPEHCDQAVRYLRQNAVEIPVWLFSVEEPLPETATLCERVFVIRDSLELFFTAQKELWPHWVALELVTWTGEHGWWPVKFAPFLLPPFRVLLMNEHHDFFAGKPRPVLRHFERRVRDWLHSSWHRIQDQNRGAWLFLFAWVAQWFSPVSRKAFHKCHGAKPLILPDVQSSGAGVLCYRYGQRWWNRQELQRQVQSSNCRYVLFLEYGVESPADELLPLFEDERTFAASRQIHFRDWKRALFAVAPFRPLQPGEASQTLAPVSTAILVDRVKLLALGVPETIVPGSAWLLLFWRAAAAGWRSYSVGRSAQDQMSVLREAPDWPYEEAEFVTRVLAEPALRMLGPREPDLSRGSIAFAHGAARPFRGKTRVLVVSPYLPFPLSHGGAVRIYNLCRALSDRVDFVLAAFREKGDLVDYPKLHEVFREVYVIDRDERPMTDRSLPRQVREYVSGSMRALIAQLCREKKVDLLQVEYTHLAGFREAAPAVPAILVEHDLTFSLYGQLADRDSRRMVRQEYCRWLAFEQHWLARYDAVWTMSKHDRLLAIEQGSHSDSTFVVANGVDLERFSPLEESKEEAEVFYVGSFRHLPNILGFEKLRHEIMPRVWLRFPNARLRVVAGPDAERYWREFLKRDYPKDPDPRVAMHGFVEDLRPLYAKASVVVVPLLVSAGTNIKVMEAMACRRPVVATDSGCAGLGLVDGNDILIRDGSPEFADAVADLLGNRDLRLRVGSQARATVESRFSWQAIADNACQSYTQLIRAEHERKRIS